MSTTELKDFEIYSNGLCHCSVCSSLSLEETLKRVNTENPTGLKNKWGLKCKFFATGEPNPCPCNISPETHKHYLFTC